MKREAPHKARGEAGKRDDGGISHPSPPTQARIKDRANSRAQFIYNGQQLLAVVERVTGGWRLTVRGREVGVFRSRAEALSSIDHDW